jgi:uncharacterized membrane protein YjfL (UPF0719 family)
MEPALSRALHAIVVFLEVLALVWIGKKATQIAARTDFDRELLSRDNPAAGVVLGGFYLALFTALSGLLAGEAGSSLGADLLLTAAHGAAAIVCLVLSAALWRPILQVDFRKDVLEGRNAGAALVAAAALVATGLIYRGALAGESDQAASVAAFFALGEGALLLAVLLYEWITPYDVYAEIADRRNLGAAIGAAGAILASGLIIGSAVTGDFTTWEESIAETLAYLLPLAALPIVRLLVVNGLLLGFGNVNREIAEDRNPAAGAVEASAYIGIALFFLEVL